MHAQQSLASSNRLKEPMFHGSRLRSKEEHDSAARMNPSQNKEKKRRGIGFEYASSGIKGRQGVYRVGITTALVYSIHMHILLLRTLE